MSGHLWSFFGPTYRFIFPDGSTVAQGNGEFWAKGKLRHTGDGRSGNSLPLSVMAALASTVTSDCELSLYPAGGLLCGSACQRRPVGGREGVEPLRKGKGRERGKLAPKSHSDRTASLAPVPHSDWAASVCLAPPVFLPQRVTGLRQRGGAGR